MPGIKVARRQARSGFRAIDCPRLLAWPTANGATALPDLLDEATYTSLVSKEPEEAPFLLNGTAGANGIFAFRPGPDTKVLALEFMSVTGGDGETQQWEFGAYGFPFVSTSVAGVTTYRPWKLLGTTTFTITLGTRTIATQVADPYDGTQTFSSATLRYGDTYTETTNDFGDIQWYSTGFGAANKSGRIIFDMAFISLIACRLVAKAASSVQELVGMIPEVN